MSAVFIHRRRVTFADTDAAGIAHFSRVLCWVEEAEHALWASVGFATHQSSSSGLPAPVGWPRAGIEARFRHPLRLDDEVELRLRVEELRGKLLVWRFEIRLGSELAADGRMPVVAVATLAEGGWGSVEIPAEMVAALEPWRR